MKALNMIKKMVLLGVVVLSLGLAAARPVSAATCYSSSGQTHPLTADGQETHG